MSQIGWSESAPANGDNAGLGAQEIRSLKTALSTGLAEEHIWPTSSGVAGPHKRGSARLYVGAKSVMSSDGTDGRMGYDTSNNLLHYLSSSGSGIVVGGYGAVVGVSGDGLVSPPAGHYFQQVFGTGRTNSSGTTALFWTDYGASNFSGRPTVLCTPVVTSSNSYAAMSVITSTTTMALVYSVGVATGTLIGTVDFGWQSIGSTSWS